MGTQNVTALHGAFLRDVFMPTVIKQAIKLKASKRWIRIGTIVYFLAFLFKCTSSFGRIRLYTAEMEIETRATFLDKRENES